MTLRASSGPLHDRHDLVMLDLDGVVYVGPDAVPGAADALAEVARAGTGIAYLTNNAARPASDVAAHLRALAMPVGSDSDVVTSAQAVAALMAEQLPFGATVLVVGGPGLVEPVREHGFAVVERAADRPEAVVQGFHPDVGWKQLAEAAFAVQNGATWYASNCDLSVPTPQGRAPGNGALVQAVASATGREPVVAGKPERPLFDETLHRMAAQRPLMVGDRIDTDIDGATALGLDSLCVLTGVSDLELLAEVEPSRRPTYVGHDLRALLDEQRPVHIDLDAGTGICGHARARVVGGAVELVAGDAESTDAVRAWIGLSWARRDAVK